MFARQMAVSLSQIQAPVVEELGHFEDYFKAALSTRVSLLNRIMGYIVSRKGKQVRPLLVFLCAKACGSITEKTNRGASLIELLHTATLVHDDVVDDAAFRRGFFSVNALWKNKIAVLVGDFLLSKGLLLSVEHKDFDLLSTVSQAVREMSEGELLQIEKARQLNITDQVYFDIIRKKTASLITACCTVGAQSAGAAPEQIEIFEQFGLKVGMAFQIKDDLFDYGDEEIGKPTGIDIREKKMTLPLIYALQTSTRSERSHLVGIVKSDNPTKAQVQEVIDYVKGKNGIGYATEVMMDYRQQAQRLLDHLPDSDARRSLEMLIAYTVERKK